MLSSNNYTHYTSSPCPSPREGLRESHHSGMEKPWIFTALQSGYSFSMSYLKNLLLGDHRFAKLAPFLAILKGRYLRFWEQQDKRLSKRWFTSYLNGICFWVLQIFDHHREGCSWDLSLLNYFCLEYTVCISRDLRIISSSSSLYPKKRVAEEGKEAGMFKCSTCWVSSI